MNGNSFLKYIHSTFFLVFSLCLLFACKASLALPFTIVPKAGVPMPKTVAKGTAVFAYYTVYNNTISARNNNYVTYLPPNVKQVMTNGTYPDTCGFSFNLSAKGKAGDSCTLQLSVSGPVDASDRNPHHHLFVCFPGGVSCAGTQYPLNIKGSQETLNTAYVTNNDLISKCPVLSNGLFGVCTTAFEFANTPFLGIAFNPEHTIAYVGTAGGILYCRKGGDGNFSLNACSIEPLGLFVYSGLAINTPGTFVYTTSTDSDDIMKCSIDANTGVLSNCTSAATLSDAIGITLNTAQTYAFIVRPALNAVTTCTIETLTGNLLQCTINRQFGDPPYAIAVTPDNNFAYVALSIGIIERCSIDNTGVLDQCDSVGNNNVFNFPVGITLNSTGTQAYITNRNSNTVSICPIQSNGQFGTCVTSGNGFNGPSSIALI
jgi:DNA-binding beta-propeller fold protein YncE